MCRILISSSLTVSLKDHLRETTTNCSNLPVLLLCEFKILLDIFQRLTVRSGSLYELPSAVLVPQSNSAAFLSCLYHAFCGILNTVQSQFLNHQRKRKLVTEIRRSKYQNIEGDIDRIEQVSIIYAESLQHSEYFCLSFPWKYRLPYYKTSIQIPKW